MLGVPDVFGVGEFEDVFFFVVVLFGGGALVVVGFFGFFATVGAFFAVVGAFLFSGHFD